MDGEHGCSATVQLPSAERLSRYTGLHLDLALGCGGVRDEDCPAWDHVVQLYVCCQDPDASLPPCR